MTTIKQDVIFKSTVTKSNLMCGFIPSSPRLALISVLIKSISVYVCCLIGKIEITLSNKRYETRSIISFQIHTIIMVRSTLSVFLEQ